MTVQLPITGHPLHTRSLTLVVSQGEGAVWHARGDVIDLRKAGFVPMMSDIQPAGIIHQMGIDLRIDTERRVIEQVDVDQPVVAIEPSRASAGECCRDPGPRLRDMQGESLGEDFARRLSAVFGGALGCSHLLTLMQMMGPAIARALDLEEALPRDLSGLREPGERLFRRAVFVDGYDADDANEGDGEAFGESVELGLQQSDFHTRPAAAVREPFARLAGEWDVRVFAMVGAGMKLERLRAAERFRTAETLGSATWVDRSSCIATLGGTPIIPGLARRVFDLLPAAPEDVLLREALLQLAPGHIQVMAAVMDRWMARGSGSPEAASAPEETASDGTKRHGMPEIGNIGGLPDSCYMWRTGGPLAGTRQTRLTFRGPK